MRIQRFIYATGWSSGKAVGRRSKQSNQHRIVLLEIERDMRGHQPLQVVETNKRYRSRRLVMVLPGHDVSKRRVFTPNPATRWWCLSLFAELLWESPR
jgi:hypothetical protein